MTFGDWANSAVNLVIGVLLGWAAYGLIGLLTSAFWPLAIIIPAMFLGVLLFDSALSHVFEKILPIGVRPADNPVRKPWPRRLSLPVGLAVGLVLAWLGFSLPFIGVL